MFTVSTANESSAEMQKRHSPCKSNPQPLWGPLNLENHSRKNKRLTIKIQKIKTGFKIVKSSKCSEQTKQAEKTSSVVKKRTENKNITRNRNKKDNKKDKNKCHGVRPIKGENLCKGKPQKMPCMCIPPGSMQVRKVWPLKSGASLMQENDHVLLENIEIIDRSIILKILEEKLKVPVTESSYCSAGHNDAFRNDNRNETVTSYVNSGKQSKITDVGTSTPVNGTEMVILNTSKHKNLRACNTEMQNSKQNLFAGEGQGISKETEPTKRNCRKTRKSQKSRREIAAETERVKLLGLDNSQQVEADYVLHSTVTEDNTTHNSSEDKSVNCSSDDGIFAKDVMEQNICYGELQNIFINVSRSAGVDAKCDNSCKTDTTKNSETENVSHDNSFSENCYIVEADSCAKAEAFKNMRKSTQTTEKKVAKHTAEFVSSTIGIKAVSSSCCQLTPGSENINKAAENENEHQGKGSDLGNSDPAVLDCQRILEMYAPECFVLDTQGDLSHDSSKLVMDSEEHSQELQQAELVHLRSNWDVNQKESNKKSKLKEMDQDESILFVNQIGHVNELNETKQRQNMPGLIESQVWLQKPKVVKTQGTQDIQSFYEPVDGNHTYSRNCGSVYKTLSSGTEKQGPDHDLANVWENIRKDLALEEYITKKVDSDSHARTNTGDQMTKHRKSNDTTSVRMVSGLDEPQKILEESCHEGPHKDVKISCNKVKDSCLATFSKRHCHTCMCHMVTTEEFLEEQGRNLRPLSSNDVHTDPLFAEQDPNENSESMNVGICDTDTKIIQENIFSIEESSKKLLDDLRHDTGLELHNTDLYANQMYQDKEGFNVNQTSSNPSTTHTSSIVNANDVLSFETLGNQNSEKQVKCCEIKCNDGVIPGENNDNDVSDCSTRDVYSVEKHTQGKLVEAEGNSKSLLVQNDNSGEIAEALQIYSSFREELQNVVSPFVKEGYVTPDIKKSEEHLMLVNSIVSSCYDHSPIGVPCSSDLENIYSTENLDLIEKGTTDPLSVQKKFVCDNKKCYQLCKQDCKMAPAEQMTLSFLWESVDTLKSSTSLKANTLSDATENHIGNETCISLETGTKHQHTDSFQDVQLEENGTECSILPYEPSQPEELYEMHSPVKKDNGSLDCSQSVAEVLQTNNQQTSEQNRKRKIFLNKNTTPSLHDGYKVKWYKVDDDHCTFLQIEDPMQSTNNDTAVETVSDKPQYNTYKRTRKLNQNYLQVSNLPRKMSRKVHMHESQNSLSHDKEEEEPENTFTSISSSEHVSGSIDTQFFVKDKKLSSKCVVNVVKLDIPNVHHIVCVGNNYKCGNVKLNKRKDKSTVYHQTKRKVGQTVKAKFNKRKVNKCSISENSSDIKQLDHNIDYSLELNLTHCSLSPPGSQNPEDKFFQQPGTSCSSFADVKICEESKVDIDPRFANSDYDAISLYAPSCADSLFDGDGTCSPDASEEDVSEVKRSSSNLSDNPTEKKLANVKSKHGLKDCVSTTSFCYDETENDGMNINSSEASNLDLEKCSVLKPLKHFHISDNGTNHSDANLQDTSQFATAKSSSSGKGSEEQEDVTVGRNSEQATDCSPGFADFPDTYQGFGHVDDQFSGLESSKNVKLKQNPPKSSTVIRLTEKLPQVCRFYKMNGTCRYGDSCIFVHDSIINVAEKEHNDRNNFPVTTEQLKPCDLKQACAPQQNSFLDAAVPSIMLTTLCEANQAEGTEIDKLRSLCAEKNFAGAFQV